MDKNQKPKTLPAGAPPPGNKNQGFTLLEILTAVSLGVGLFLLLLSIYGLSAKSLAVTETQAELAQNARLITERISREIRQARQIATLLPPDDGDPLNPPKNEIEFQDGHQSALVQYIRYYSAGSDLKRQLRRYYFPSEPETYVPADSRDDFGNPPQLAIINDELVGQYLQSMKFYGQNLINIVLELNKNNILYPAKTAIYARNL